MYSLDTNICIALLNGHVDVRVKYRAVREQCYVSAIVLAELYKGAYCSQRIEPNLRTIQEFIRPLPIISFDDLAAAEFGEIQADLRRLGQPTGDVDAQIAAIARW